ncbi:MAG: AAA family ATPase [Lachnospiraceae bacterium]|nr:AAA family ATPase [Lachnospiraceae bacterium]
MTQNRKTATKLLLVQWSRFQNVSIKLEGSTLFTGVNGSGKSTILDAMTYLLTGNTQFNKAAKDRDRTVKGYVRGDTKSNGAMRYLRQGQIISYVAMEFWSPSEQENMVIGVCIESQDEVSNPTSSWFICKNATIEDINFVNIEGKNLYVTPKSLLQLKGVRMKSAEFMGRERGTEQIVRALGLRCEVSKYRSKLIKMMAFNPENNIDQFIAECVLEPGTVNSLKELRQQREQFEHIKKIYEDLRDGKEKLEEVECKIQEYETRKRNLDIREMLLRYQELLVKQKEREDIQFRLVALEQKKLELEKQRENVQGLFEEARKRLQIAESNDAYQGMQTSIQNLENQINLLEFSIKQEEEKVAKLLRLQKSLTAEISWTIKEWAEESKRYLLHIADEGYSVDKKRKELIFFIDSVEKLQNDLGTEKVHLEDELNALKQELVKLEQQLKTLESNQAIFPEEIVNAKQVIKDEFAKRGIATEVRTFAELVQSIKDVSWRRAIETFLGRKRFYIIVDGQYCHEAMKVLQEKKLHVANVVITDKLPDSEVIKGSAAEQLVIPNVYARRYANYLLNRIHLCETLEELHEYPKGGLMKDGMLAKSYSVACMNIKKTQICLGQDAIEWQKKAVLEQKRVTQEMYNHKNDTFEKVCGKIGSLRSVDLELTNYQLEAPDLFVENQEKKRKYEDNIKQIKGNPEFLAVLQEQQDAQNAFNEIDKRRSKIDSDIGECKKELENELERKKTIAGEIHSKQNMYDEIRMTHIELENAMLEEYSKLHAKRGEIRVITEKTVQNLRTDLDACIKAMENVQLDYCRISEIDINKRGIGYIPFYREEYRNIANVKIEEAHSRLVEQAQKLESAFMNDFVAEINETIGEAKREIDAINRELKQIPFGQDTYKFKMDEKPERMLFFRICKKLENYMNSPEIYMNSSRDDEEMERDIQEFMNMILNEEDEAEYTDYRKYFTYDMEITSHQGGEEITADLSKKQGSASNGEKQTPYFIILAASLLQCYPRRNCCARLAFIDEAFSALSRERIEQMVKYLEENDFQVIYAAPPEKISSIGQFIQSTVSLVTTGRYTNAVEGLVRVNEIYS